MKLPFGHRRDGSLLALSDLVGRSRRRVSEDIRQRCHSIYLGDHQALCRVLGRYAMYVDTRDVGFASHMLMHGAWEMWLTEYLIATVRPGWHVLDIGANYGYYSLLLADLVGASGHCTAFEPNPAAAQAVRQSLSINGLGGQSDVREMALTSVSGGQSWFFLPTGEPKNASLTNAPNPAVIASGEGSFIEVPLMALDDLALSGVDFIKIDAEGAEDQIMQGMATLIARDRPRMVVEYNRARLKDAPAFLDGLLAVYGELRHLEDSGRVVSVTARNLLEDHLGQDWLLVLE